MSSTQMLKGILKGCLLAVISEGEVYGYEMIEKLSSYGFDMISEGSIYPLLLRMKKEKLVATENKNSPNGPNRKYYTLTQKGLDELKAFVEDWGKLNKSVNSLIKEK